MATTAGASNRTRSQSKSTENVVQMCSSAVLTKKRTRSQANFDDIADHTYTTAGAVELKELAVVLKNAEKRR